MDHSSRRNIKRNDNCEIWGWFLKKKENKLVRSYVGYFTREEESRVNTDCLRGSSPQKMKISLSLFTHPHVVLTLYKSFFLLFNTKEDILKNVGNQKVDGSH